MAVTLRDVATRAGVSPVVVSRVLHNKASTVRVSEATAERVRAAAADLGYRVNVFARNFRAQQSRMIGVLHGIGFARPLFDSGSRYFAALVDGIVNGAFQHGYSVTLCPTLLGQSPEDAMSDGRFDGLVWYSSHPSPECRQMLMRCSVPLVLVHAHAADFENRYPAVNCDNDQGIGLAVSHLLELGHQDVAFAYEDYTGNHETLARLEAFRRHMADHGLPRSESDFIRSQWGQSELDSYLSSGPAHTAVICFTDQFAADFMRRAAIHNVRVPEDLSVVGFDSTGFCNEQRPALTSVFQPLAAMGERAIDLLAEAITGKLPEPLEVTLPCSFDVRGSTTASSRTHTLGRS